MGEGDLPYLKPATLKIVILRIGNWIGNLNSTQSQNVPPPDGIGDTPRVIDSDSQDNYPLMTPSAGAPPAVILTIEPPGPMLSGTSYVIEWLVIGSGSVSHTNVHYSASPSFTSYTETSAQSGAPGTYTDSISVPCSFDKTNYFKAHAIMNGKDYYSAVISRICAILPKIEHTCAEGAETNSYFVVNATVTDTNEISEVRINYSSLSYSENYSMVSEDNNVWTTTIYTPSEAGALTYHVLAKDITGYWNKTNNCTVTIILDTIPPETPKGLSVAATDNPGELKLTWNPVSGDTEKYIIYRADSEDGNFQKIGEVPHHQCWGGQCTFIDKNLADGTTYWYKVSAVDEVGNESPLAAAINGTTIGLLWYPIIIIAIVAAVAVSIILLSWLKAKRKKSDVAVQNPPPPPPIQTLPPPTPPQMIQPSQPSLPASPPPRVQQTSILASNCKKCGMRLDPKYILCPQCGTRR